MHLPECKILGPDWRFLGTRVTFEGYIERKPDPDVRMMPGDKVRRDHEFIKSLGFSGRLWRDSLVSIGDAVRATQDYIRTHGDVCTIGKYPAAICLTTGPRIDLIGVIPEARGIGLAERLIRHAIDGPIIAGTYSDNEGAMKLYRKMGLELTKEEDVYHR